MLPKDKDHPHGGPPGHDKDKGGNNDPENSPFGHGAPVPPQKQPGPRTGSDKPERDWIKRWRWRENPGPKPDMPGPREPRGCLDAILHPFRRRR